jgi:hypothetical protein
MSPKLKAVVVVGSMGLVILGAMIFSRARAWPALPNSPVALGELIDKSDLIVYAKVTKVENPLAPFYRGTNRWVRKAIGLVGGQDRQFATAHLDVIQNIKGPAVDRVLVDYPVGFAKYPAITTEANIDGVVAFVYRQRGAYHPVAYSYGTKVLGRREADVLLRRAAELVATEKMSGSARERSRAEWFVKLMENPATRWDGAASWLYGSDHAGEALRKFPADLAKRVEAVALRDEPLGDGDDLLLRELAPAHAREVVQRVRNYFRFATKRDWDEAMEEPWRCLGAMELLIAITDMPPAFRERFRAAPYPNMSSAGERRNFIQAWLPEIETRLKGVGTARLERTQRSGN